MGNPNELRRFRINPVEIAVFSIVTLVFINSVYSLFYDRQGFHPAALSPMAANPTSEGRAPASVSQTFLNVEVKCGGVADQDTGASKVRLIGTLCASRGPASATESLKNDSSGFVKLQITNAANKFAATVFTDLGSGKFSTDYIPLNTGKNPLHLEFVYQGGRTIAQDFVINKN